MTQLELTENVYDGPSSYFVSCVFGFAIGETRAEAIEKLVNHFRRDLAPIVKNSQKRGQPGCVMWSCRVHGGTDAKYQVRNFAPVGIDFDDGQEHWLTYLTAKQHAVYTGGEA